MTVLVCTADTVLILENTANNSSIAKSGRNKHKKRYFSREKCTKIKERYVYYTMFSAFWQAHALNHFSLVYLHTQAPTNYPHKK